MNKLKGKTIIIFTFCLSIFVLILVGTLTYRSANSYGSESRWVTHTHEVISEMQAILLNIENVETAQRGYVITDKIKYLDPYKEGVDSIQPELDRLRNLISDNKAQQKLLDSIYPVVNSKVRYAKRVIALRQTEGFEAAQKLMETDIGINLMNKIRNRADLFIENEKILLYHRLIRAENSRQHTLNTIIMSVGLAIGIVLLTLYFFIKDFTRRIRSEKQVMESEYRIKGFLESLPIGVFVLGVDGTAYYANGESQKILGKGLVTGAALDKLPELYNSFIAGTNTLYPADKQPIVRALNGEENIMVDDMEIEKEGRRIPLRINASRITNAENKTEYAIAVFEDVSDIRETERKLIEARKIAEESAILKEAFLANMSHEIRTPMNAIIGFTDLLLKRNLSETEHDYVRTIKTSGENLLRIINDVLDVSKIESGMMSFEIYPLSIKETFSSLQAMMSQKAKAKNISLSFNCDSNLPNTVLGDPTRLTQIILNLVGNAIKFTPKGSVEVLAKLAGYENETFRVEFSVKDTGIGISGDKLNSIFERFTQGESHTTRNYGGTGLGLSIAKQLVELQGGHISVASKLNEGSTFTFILPFKKAGDTLVQTTPKLSGIAIEGLKKKAILVVEDNPVNVKFLFALFQVHGLKADLAENGRIAVEKVKLNNYDLVLMDLEMPEMNGYEATGIIRNELKSNVPIIAMSAHAMAGENEKCIRAGMNAYLSKPLREEQLFEKMFNISAEYKPAPLPADTGMDLVNLDFITKAMRGNKADILETIDIFLRQVPEDLTIINEAATKGDYTAIRQFTHRMRSSISLMGISKIEIILAEMETLATAQEQPGKINDLLITLNLLTQQAIEEMKMKKENYS